MSYQTELEKKVKEQGEIVRWMITLAVSVGALLEVIDTSIVNVALPHIQGNLGATLSEAGWVITGYSIANAVIIPLSAWLGGVFGRKGYFIFSMIGFTAASMLCGFSSTLLTLVIARILQGLFGGGLLAKAQAILFETFPKEQQGFAQGVFGVCVIVGPIIGPTLGGYMTDTFDWRWIFFINLPFGIIATLLCNIFLPDDSKEEKVNPKIDFPGIFWLIVCIGSFQYILEKGQDDDWFSSKTICALAVMAVAGLVLFLFRELTTKAPAVDLKVLRHRSVAGGVTFSMVMGAALYGTSLVIPNFAQTALSYTAMQSGLLQLPGSVASAILMPVTGLITSKFDCRLLVGIGAVVSAIVMFNLTGLNINTGPDDFFWPLIFRGFATVLMYMPLTMATLGSCPREDIQSASAFFSLARQLGGSIGIAALTTVLIQRQEFHRVVLIEKVNPFNAAAMERLAASKALFEHQGVNPSSASYGATLLVNGDVLRQSVVMSYADTCWLVGVLLCVSLPLLFLLDSGKRPGAKAAAAEAH